MPFSSRSGSQIDAPLCCDALVIQRYFNFIQLLHLPPNIVNNTAPRCIQIQIRKAAKRYLRRGRLEPRCSVRDKYVALRCGSRRYADVLVLMSRYSHYASASP